MSFLSCTATLGLNYVVTEPLLLASQPLLATPTVTANYTLANGLVAVTDAIDLHWEYKSRVIAGGATQSYTLSALIDQLPRTLAFTDVKAFIVKVESRVAGNWLNVSPGATHGWVAMIPSTIKVFLVYANIVDKTDSFPVVANTTDQIDINNPGGTPITYSIAVGGNSG